MFSQQLKRNIIQAIDHLRNRKARPDLHRICNMLKRRHHFSFADTARCIEYLLNMGIVIKVEYKGSISYRDASKWKKGHVAGQIINTDVLVAKLQAAIDAVIGQQSAPADGSEGSASGGRSGPSTETGAGELCATAEQIEVWLTKQPGDMGCRLTGDALLEVLTRELETETLVRITRIHAPSGYAVGRRVIPSQPPRQKCPTPAKSPVKKEVKPNTPVLQSKEIDETSQDVDMDTKRGRPPSKRKRIQKNHGDDFEVLPIRKSRKLTPSECSYDAGDTGKEKDAAEETPHEPFDFATRFRKCCEEHLTETPSHHEGQEDELLMCASCNMRAHPSCINYSTQLLENIDRTNWCCLSCKQCEVCKTLLRTATPVTCSLCDKAYHRACHKPLLRKRPKGPWACMACTGDTGAEEHAVRHDENSQDSIPLAFKTENHDTSFPPTPCDSPSPDIVVKMSPEMPVLEPMVQRAVRREEKRSPVSRFDGQPFPDVTQWSVQRIRDFVAMAGFPDQAEALKEEEIDGEALMDLKRVDVLTRFSFKLGPALKLYRLILNMQTNGNASDFI